MPSLKMKTKISTTSLVEKVCLGVCQKSSTISKRSCSHVTFSLQTAEPDSCIQKCQDGHALSRKDMHTGDDRSDGAIDHQESLNEGDCHFQKQSSNLLDSGTAWRIESIDHTSNLETMFSPSLEPNEVHSVPNLDDNGGSNEDRDVLVKADGTDGHRQPSDYQTCSVSDFFISDMIIASLPFDGSTVDDDITKTKPFPDYKYAEPNMLFDMVEECMVLPFLENNAKLNKSNDTDSWEEAVMDPDNSSLFLAFNQTRPCNQESDLNAESDQGENFDPHSFIKNLPELSNVVSNFQSSTLPKQSRRRKSVTLVLDLDETLIHSTLEHCDDADFTFSVFFNMKEHTVYVKQRPHLHTFLERVADMFEVVIFTASQSIYAEQLLDILDPERRLISRRVYRESCIYSDGTYTKDLTVLGVDLAKVAIIDNCPQVFRLQVNNGIPIKSWFSDPSDCALISLIPFLETLVGADDVRPIIAKSFGNKE